MTQRKLDSEDEVVIFTEAVNIAPHKRAALLKARCGFNEQLRSKVEQLLKAHDRLGDFLEKPLIKRPRR